MYNYLEIPTYLHLTYLSSRLNRMNCMVVDRALKSIRSTKDEELNKIAQFVDYKVRTGLFLHFSSIKDCSLFKRLSDVYKDNNQLSLMDDSKLMLRICLMINFRPDQYTNHAFDPRSAQVFDHLLTSGKSELKLIKNHIKSAIIANKMLGTLDPRYLEMISTTEDSESLDQLSIPGLSDELIYFIRMSIQEALAEIQSLKYNMETNKEKY